MLHLEGKKFGLWTVIKKTDERKFQKGKPRIVIWECLCECGTIRNVSYSILKNIKKPRSCGCSRKIRSKEIFESNYEKTEGCWIWNGVISTHGYGKIGKNGLAHRKSYEYVYGKIPKGLQVCHKCDNRTCVNPAHLFLGTNADNLKDMTDKGRRARGSKIANSILDEQKVLEIRKKRLSGWEYQQIADEYKISWYLVRSVCKNRQWKHVPLGEECKNYICPHRGYTYQKIQ